ARLCGLLTMPPHCTTSGYALYYVGLLESTGFLSFLHPPDFFLTFRRSHLAPFLGPWRRVAASLHFREKANWMPAGKYTGPGCWLTGKAKVSVRQSVWLFLSRTKMGQKCYDIFA